MTTNLVEGYFIITTDGLIFEVKGIVHPKDRVIAYLRYVPTQSGYQKVYDLNERENYLRTNYASYLWFSEPHGRVVQSVPYTSIETILSPIDRLTSLRNNIGKITDLEQASINLVEKLVKSTGIENTDIGITGSQLIGIAKKNSDIDLVVYGLKTCQEFYSRLSQNISSIAGIQRYTGNLLDDHVSFRWGAHTEMKSLLREIERVKVLQGLFEGYHFFIRLVKTTDDLDYVYGDFSFQMKGQNLVSGIVTDDSNSMFTPCEYLVECGEVPNLRKLVSYRGRFTEQISKGMAFEARGRLEMVTNHKDGDQYLQLVMGELPTDYLIPI
ncbi:MAG: nucleotidyltransferase domain-containing protein [Candidatus Thorarchaeota archaeon]